MLAINFFNKFIFVLHIALESIPMYVDELER